MPPSWQPVPACVRHGHSAGGPFLYATTIVLQAEPIFFAATTIVLQAGRLSCSSDGAAGGTILLCRNNESATGGPLLHTTTIASILKSRLEIKNRCTKDSVNLENLASIPKSGHEIMNRCTLECLIGENLASIRKSGPEIKNRCTKQPIFSTRPQQIHQPIPPARVPSRVDDASCLGCLHGAGSSRFDSGGESGC